MFFPVYGLSFLFIFFLSRLPAPYLATNSLMFHSSQQGRQFVLANPLFPKILHPLRPSVVGKLSSNGLEFSVCVRLLGNHDVLIPSESSPHELTNSLTVPLHPRRPDPALESDSGGDAQLQCSSPSSQFSCWRCAQQGHQSDR